MDGITLTPLKKIHHPKGDIFHAMKASDVGFNGFGEAYFSTVNGSDIKGWKKHSLMTLNIIVIEGEIEFVIYNDKDFYKVKLSQYNYQRLTVRAGLWMAFRGTTDRNMLLNIASIEHVSSEAITKELGEISYEW